LKRGWTRFWQLGSVATTLAVALTAGPTGARAQQAVNAQRHNELTLAGLRPGHNRIDAPKNVFRTLTLAQASEPGVLEWKNACGATLRVETNENHVVQTVTADACTQGASMPAETQAALAAGKGLKLGNSCAQAVELYGEPESRSPSVRGTRKLELLFYSFDWAGEDVPQSMEVSCDSASGRVAEITLAASTL
jgi:hypothetical protein